MKNVRFVCSQNRLRSPTAEQVFSKHRDIEVASAGTNHDADTPPDDHEFMDPALVRLLEVRVSKYLG